MNSFKVYDFDISFIVTGKFGHVFQRKGFNFIRLPGPHGCCPIANTCRKFNGDPQVVPLRQNLVDRVIISGTGFTKPELPDRQCLLYRCQEVNVTLQLPRHLLKRTAFSNLQVYAQGNDLFTIWPTKMRGPRIPAGYHEPTPQITLGIKM